MSAPPTLEDLIARASAPLPSSEDGERGILSCLIQSPALIAETRMKLSPDAFHFQRWRVLYQSLLAMDEKGLPIEPASVTDWLRTANDLERIGGASTISEIYTFIDVSGSWQHYQTLVLNKHLLRLGILAHAHSLAALFEHGAADPSASVTDCIATGEQRIFTVLSEAQDGGGQGKIIDSMLMTEQWLEEMDKIVENKGRIRGIATGWTDIDRAFGGLNPDGSGDLVVIAGYPGNGKTAAAVSLIEKIAVEDKHRLLVFPLEMGRMGVGHRLYLGRARVDIAISRNGFAKKGLLSRNGESEVMRSAQDIATSPIWWDDSNNIDIDTLCARTKVHVRNHGIKAIIIDHFGHVKASSPEGKKDKLQGQIEIMEKLHAIRRELGILVVLLVQLNKAGRDTPLHQAPTLASLRGASEIGELATHCMFLHRPVLARPFRTLGSKPKETAQRQEAWAKKVDEYKKVNPECWSPEIVPENWVEEIPDSAEGETLFQPRPWHMKDYEEHLVVNIAKNRHGATPDNICLRFELERQRFTNRTTLLHANNPHSRQVELIGF
jgi:replicative DNA helicase